jgi:YD repeat-containing protein
MCTGNAFVQDSLFNSNNSREEYFNNWDGYGRTISLESAQSPTGTNYDTVSVAYGWSGNFSTVATSQPCSAAGGGGCTTVHTKSFDPLGRLITSTTTSNETVTHTYNKNDEFVALTPVPTGDR